MKKVYSSDDPVMCGFLKGILQNAGIACLIRNELLQGGVGEIPILETWPELWVLEDDEEAPARRLIAEMLADDGGDAGAWECPQCSESNEAQFSMCWKCGTDRFR